MSRPRSSAAVASTCSAITPRAVVARPRSIAQRDAGVLGVGVGDVRGEDGDRGEQSVEPALHLGDGRGERRRSGQLTDEHVVPRVAHPPRSWLAHRRRIEGVAQPVAVGVVEPAGRRQLGGPGLDDRAEGEGVEDLGRAERAGDPLGVGGRTLAGVVRDDGAARSAPDRRHVASLLERPDRLAQRDAADSQLLRQLSLGGQALTRLDDAEADRRRQPLDGQLERVGLLDRAQQRAVRWDAHVRSVRSSAGAPSR